MLNRFPLMFAVIAAVLLSSSCSSPRSTLYEPPPPWATTARAHVFVLYRTNVTPPHKAQLAYRVSDARALRRGWIVADQYTLKPVSPGVVKISLSYNWTMEQSREVRGKTRQYSFPCRPGDVVVIEALTLLQREFNKRIIAESYRTNILSGAIARLLLEQYRAGDNINIDPYIDPPPAAEDFPSTLKKLDNLTALRREGMINGREYEARQDEILKAASGIVSKQARVEGVIRSAMQACGYFVEFKPDGCTLGRRVIDKMIRYEVLYSELSSIRLISPTVIEITHRNKDKNYFAFPEKRGDLAGQVVASLKTLQTLHLKRQRDMQ